MKLCIIPGDGIGVEVIRAAQRVLRALPLEVEMVEAAAGWGTFQETGTALPEATLEAARSSDAILFGAVASPSHPVPGYRSPIVALRRALDLYANIRPVGAAAAPVRSVSREGGQNLVDLVVVRENTEGLYAGRERLEDNGNTAIAERVITRRGSERIARTAFELARERATRLGPRKSESGQRKVTIVHKANILRLTDGLFREVALEVARDYPEIAVEELLVDTAAMHLAQSPERFGVIVTTNLFGDILSDVACIHGGGLGLASSANIGDQYALFEPVHGAAPDIAGRGIANPLAALGCLVLLLEWKERKQPQRGDATSLSQMLREAIGATLREGPHTSDLGGDATTEEVTSAIIEKLRKAPEPETP
ncbi:MAG: isocitrate/isopropylmalate dehydrogenase family protein [Chloroflexaceae bacterium]|nr:isocitrate/isopropylmalate dehydrogenase family protein [Chloroflexaceae bacterium]